MTRPMIATVTDFGKIDAESTARDWKMIWGSWMKNGVRASS